MRAANIKDLSGGFGRALQYFRSSEFITAEMLARTSGIDEQDIARMERGEREPTLSEFLRLALAIPVSPSYLSTARLPNGPTIRITVRHARGLTLTTRGCSVSHGSQTVE
jgi:transcriptional regulator with XRE-family HTH domain